MIEYLLIHSGGMTQSQFEKKVNEHLHKGWTLHGGVSVARLSGARPNFTQVIVRERMDKYGFSPVVE